MTDPVSLQNGHSFDRGTVEQWFALGHTTCPLTGSTLGSLAVVPNITLRKAIEEWRETHHKLIPRSAVELHEQIGAGSFKKVYRG